MKRASWLSFLVLALSMTFLVSCPEDEEEVDVGVDIPTDIVSDQADVTEEPDITPDVPADLQPDPDLVPDIPVEPPPLASVIVTEIMVNPCAAPAADGQWFEIHNIGSTTVDLAGWAIKDDGIDIHVLPGPLSIGPGQSRVLGRNSDTTANGGVTLNYVYSGFSLDQADEVILVDAFEREVDRVAYDLAELFAIECAALSLDANAYTAAANDDANNWCYASLPYGQGDLGTPGQLNPPCLDDAIDWCRLDRPASLTAQQGDTLVVYARLFEDLLTDRTSLNDPYAGLIAEVGFGPASSHPAIGTAWAWSEAAANAEWVETDNEPDIDEYLGEFEAAAPGTYDYAFRVQLNGGEFIYCDLNTGVEGQDGSENGYQVANAGHLEVVDPCNPNPCTRPPIASCDGNTLVTYASIGTCTVVDRRASCTHAEASRTDCGDDDLFCTEGACTEWKFPAPGELILTEIMQNPMRVDDSLGEWFELANLTETDMNLKGLVFTDDGTNLFELTEDLFVEGHRFVVFGPNDNTETNGGVTIDYAYPYSSYVLGNSSDAIIITLDDVEIDRVAWDNGVTFPDPNGASMQLSLDRFSQVANDLGENWCEPTAAYGTGDLGTPGVANDYCQGGDYDVNWCRLQAPPSAELGLGGQTTVTGRLYIYWLTDRNQAGNDPVPGTVLGQLGLGPDGIDPSTGPTSFTWVDAAPDGAWSDVAVTEPDYDQYIATLTAPTMVGTYDYAYRFSGDGGATWRYCDLDAGVTGQDGSENGYQTANAGHLWVKECEDDGDCEGGQHCDPATYACVECYDNSHCLPTVELSCVGNTLTAWQGVCNESNTCQDAVLTETPCGTEYCNPLAPQCVQCLIDDHCEPSVAKSCDVENNWLVTWEGVCDTYTCKDNVAGTLDCESEYCSPDVLECVECLEDSHCPADTPVCYEDDTLTTYPGVCVDYECDFGEEDIPCPTELPYCITDDCFECAEDSHCDGYPFAVCNVEYACETGCSDYEYEPNDDYGTAPELTGNDWYDGLVLCPNDQDWFKVQLTMDVESFFSIVFDGTKAAGDLDLYLWNETATMVGTYTSGQGYEEIRFEPTESGTYYLQVDGAADTDHNVYDLVFLPTGLWCRLDRPEEIFQLAGTAVQVYGRYEIVGITDADTNGNDPLPAAVSAQLGFGPGAGDFEADWTWVDGALNPEYTSSMGGFEASYDEFVGTLTTPEMIGTYDYAYRVSANRGATWFYCDLNAGAGADGNQDGYAPENAGKMEIVECQETIDCAGSAAGAYCNTMTWTCVECLEHSHCPVEAPYCLDAVNQCVLCLEDSHCAGYPFAICGTGNACEAGCSDYAYEPNDDYGTAPELAANSWIEDLVICTQDVDWFKVQLPEESDAFFSIVFDGTKADGDLDLFLFDDSQNAVGTHTSASGHEEIRFEGTPAGTYYLQVWGFSDTDFNVYDLVFLRSGLWCRLDHPEEILEAEGTAVPVYGRYEIKGITDVDQTQNDPLPAGVMAQVGYGPGDSDPALAVDWTWVDGALNPDYISGVEGFEASYDEFVGTLFTPETIGTYDYAYRVSANYGAAWVYCDTATGTPGKDGSEDGYSPDNAGKMNIVECIDHADCAGAAGGEYCDEDTWTCVECLEDAHCAESTVGSFCDPSLLLCVECYLNDQCPDFPFEECITNGCMAGCIDDGFEENDTGNVSYPLEGNAEGNTFEEGLVVCASDADWYKVTLNADDEAVITVEMPWQEPEGFTIHDIQNPNSPDHPNIGEGVEVTGVVTAKRSSGFYMQHPEGGPWSGIYVYRNGKDITSVQVGHTVSVDGEYNEYFGLSQIVLDSFTIVSETINELVPEIVNPADIANGGTYEEEYESVLVQVVDVTVIGTMPDYGRFQVTDGLMVDDYLYPYTMPNTNDTFTRIAGVMDYYYEVRYLYPRSADDMAGEAIRPANGDLDLYLYGPDFYTTEIASSTTSYSLESIRYTPTATGTYYILVEGVSIAQNTYDLTVITETYSAGLQCRLHDPTSILDLPEQPYDVTGRVFQAGLTDQNQSGNDPVPGVVLAELGWGDNGTNPSLDPGAWSWIAAGTNPAYAGAEPTFDEYITQLTTPAAIGTYDYAYRFSGDGGLTWVYCDTATGTQGEDGSEDGYQVENAGDMIVVECLTMDDCPDTPATACLDNVVTVYTAECLSYACNYPVNESRDCETQICGPGESGDLTCVDCTSNDQCIYPLDTTCVDDNTLRRYTTNGVCDQGLCGYSPDPDVVCTGDTPYCYAEADACVACITNDHCPAYVECAGDILNSYAQGECSETYQCLYGTPTPDDCTSHAASENDYCDSDILKVYSGYCESPVSDPDRCSFKTTDVNCAALTKPVADCYDEDTVRTYSGTGFCADVSGDDYCDFNFSTSDCVEAQLCDAGDCVGEICNNRADDDTDTDVDCGDSACYGAVACTFGYNFDFEDWKVTDPPVRFVEDPTEGFDVLFEEMIYNTGTASARLTSTGAGTFDLLSELSYPVETGMVVTVHAWIYDNNANGTAFVGFVDDDFQFDLATGGSTDHDYWIEYTHTTTIGTQTSLQPVLRLVTTGAISDGIYTDDWDLSLPYAWDIADTVDFEATLIGTNGDDYLRVGINNDRVLYVATPRAGSEHDRMVFFYLDDASSTTTVSAPWAKCGTVPAPSVNGELFALVHSGGDTYCRWYRYGAPTAGQFNELDVAVHSCYVDNDGSHFDLKGALNLDILSGSESYQLHGVIAAASVLYETNDYNPDNPGSGKLAHDRQVPSSANQDDNLDANELWTGHRADLLVSGVTQCFNSVKDSLETDVDCGGILCAPCPCGLSCLDDTDCLSLICDNQAGGTFTCVECLEDTDCESLNCDNGEGGTFTCFDATCDDGIQNQGEAGVDCGTGICDPCPLNLFFSEYVEGSSNNKALEIYNNGVEPALLSNCSVLIYGNVSGSPTTTITLNSVSLAVGDVYVLCDNDSALAILEVCDQESSASWYNGDDAVALQCGTEIQDIFGEIGFDPGSQWGSDLQSTADNTLRRYCSVTQGVRVNPEEFNPSVEWAGYAVDTFGGLGDPACVNP